MRFSNRWLAVFCSLLVAPAAMAFEVGAYVDLSNMDFTESRSSSETTLPGDRYVWGVSATGRQELSDQIALDLTFRHDPVLRNVGYTLLTYSDEFFSIQLGPFFGIMNSPSTILQSGLSTTVQLFVPGAMLSLRSDNSLSGRLVVDGDYIQELSELSLGLLAENVIPTAYVKTKRYTWKTSAGESVDRSTQYGLRTDIFQKNIAYGVVLDFAYQDASRSFVTDAATTIHAYGSLLLGTEVSIDLFERLSLLVDMESSIYMFGTEALLGAVRADQFLFRMTSGIAYSF
jgi:hypothetical protein